MGLFKRLFGTKQIEGAMYIPNGMTFHRFEETETNEIWMRLSVSRKGDNVSIEMYGLEKVNVCLASFLTKGVSYAQEKFNEYRQSTKSEAGFGVSESIMAALKDVAHEEARKGCKPIKRE